MIPESVSLHGSQPVSAYGHMLALLGPHYLETRPPAAGVDLTVAGFDGAWTVWAVTYEDAVRLRPLIARHMGLRLVTAVPYLDTDDTPGDNTP